MFGRNLAWRVWWALAWTCVGMPQAMAADCPSPLRIAVSSASFPPLLMGESTEFEDPPGWLVVALRQTVKRLGCPATLLRLPGLRLAAAIERGQVEFAGLYGPTPERLKRYRFPLDARGEPDSGLAPVFGHLAFFVAGDLSPARAAALWDGHTLAPDAQLGVVAGTTQEGIAQLRGWKFLASPPSFNQSLLMLRAHRFEVLLTTREAVPPVERVGPKGVEELSPLVDELPYFFVASLDQARQHPAYSQAFWRTLCETVRELAPTARGSACVVAPQRPPAGRAAASRSRPPE